MGPQRLPRRHHGPWRSAAACSTMVVALVVSGCLFPPVSPLDVDPGDNGERLPGPEIFEQRTYLNATADGLAGPSASAGGQVEGMNFHVFELPPRVDAFVVTLDWEHPHYDLDMTVRLYLDPDDGSPVWENENTAGNTGFPDAPATLEGADRSRIYHEEETYLRVSVYAKAGMDVPYELTVRAVHLVPVET